MKSIQYVYDEKDETELITKGYMNYNDGSWHISYEDSEATGFKGAVTKIMACGEKYASVTRTGAANSDLMIEPGKKHHCHYMTPYGAMEVGIYAEHIKNSLASDGGTLEMKYTLDINSTYISDNEIILDVKKL